MDERRGDGRDQPDAGKNNGRADEDETAEHVLIDNSKRFVGEREEVRHAIEIAGHERDVGGLNGDIAAERAHRDAEIAGGERGRIIHPVAYDHDFAAAVFHFLHRLLFLFRQTIGLEVGQADVCAMAAATRPAIAGKHGELLDAFFTQIRDDAGASSRTVSLR